MIMNCMRPEKDYADFIRVCYLHGVVRGYINIGDNFEDIRKKNSAAFVKDRKENTHGMGSKQAL